MELMQEVLTDTCTYTAKISPSSWPSIETKKDNILIQVVKTCYY